MFRYQSIGKDNSPRSLSWGEFGALAIGCHYVFWKQLHQVYLLVQSKEDKNQLDSLYNTKYVVVKIRSGTCIVSLSKFSTVVTKMYISNLVNKIINTGLNCKKNTCLII